MPRPRKPRPVLPDYDLGNGWKIEWWKGIQAYFIIKKNDLKADGRLDDKLCGTISIEGAKTIKKIIDEIKGS